MSSEWPQRLELNTKVTYDTIVDCRKNQRSNTRVKHLGMFLVMRKLGVSISIASIQYIRNIRHYLMPYSNKLFLHMRKLTCKEFKLFFYDHS